MAHVFDAEKRTGVLLRLNGFSTDGLVVEYLADEGTTVERGFDVRSNDVRARGHCGAGRCTQWRNDAPGAPATPGGAVLRGRQIVIKYGTILQD